jgi:hypothetical protein
LNAAWRGKRSISARSEPGSTFSPRTAAATISGNADASAETAPTAPAAIAGAISPSNPTKTSSPSIR